MEYIYALFNSFTTQKRTTNFKVNFLKRIRENVLLEGKLEKFHIFFAINK